VSLLPPRVGRGPGAGGFTERPLCAPSSVDHGHGATTVVPPLNHSLNASSRVGTGQPASAWQRGVTTGHPGPAEARGPKVTAHFCSGRQQGTGGLRGWSEPPRKGLGAGEESEGRPAGVNRRPPAGQGRPGRRWPRDPAGAGWCQPQWGERPAHC
jgi:hypothetical protein